MKVLVAAALACLAVPATGLAQPRLITQEVPLHGERALQAQAPRFNLVGLHWRGTGSVLFRTRSVGGRWSEWRDAAPEIADLPDALADESQTRPGWRLGNPYWVGESDAIRYRFRGDVQRLRAHFVASPVEAVPGRTLAIAGAPPIVPRSAWKANEAIRRGGPRYAQSLRFAVVHHTAGTNAYGPAQSAAIVRGIQLYHVRSNGWDDLGYNFLVDKYGQVFEGRYGGIERNVVGAHAEGFNTGSVGIAVIGSYENAQPSALVLDTLAQVIAWRLDVAHVDPLSSFSFASGGNSRFPSGAPVPLYAVAGHRDTGPTACPGLRLYRQLRTVAGKAAELGLPKLYEPLAQGRPGERVRFTARLSSPRPWTVTVTDAAGMRLATGNGDGTAVDWTWDATFAAPGRYTYAIEAGTDVRPARGIVGQAPTSLTVTGAQARPSTFTPNGDSIADATVISYTLSIPATVTATLRDPFGRTLATLFSVQKKVGRQTFRFTAAGIADGRYTVVIVARASNGREARSEVPIVVDRTLAAFAAAPSVFSPNGDGRVDQLAFTFVLAAPARVKIRIAGGPTVFEGDLAPGAQRIAWGTRLRDGKHTAAIEAIGPFGPRLQRTTFIVDTVKPRLRLISGRAARFWASEAGTAVFVVGGRRVDVPVAGGNFTARAATGRRFTVVLWDRAGNRSSRVRFP